MSVIPRKVHPFGASTTKREYPHGKSDSRASLDIFAGIIKLRLSERRAMYAFCFTAIKRLAGAGNIIAPNVIRMPNNRGFVFNCTWDKTLRMGSHCFGFLCMLHIESWCAHCIIDEWVLLAKSMNISFDRGLLFPRLEYDGTIKHNKRWRAKDLSDSLDRD